MNKNIIAILFLSSFILVGCIARYPTDLSVSDVEIVDYKYQSLLPAPPPKGSHKMIDPYRDYLLDLSYKNGFSRISINDADVDPFFNDVNKLEQLQKAKKSRLLLKVNFKTKENLSKFKENKNYSLGNSPYFCNSPKAYFLEGYPSVYWKRLNLRFAAVNQIDRDDEGYVTYFIYIHGDDDKFTALKPPQDICFYLRGGNNSGFGYKSDIVVIPKEMIMKSLGDYKNK